MRHFHPQLRCTNSHVEGNHATECTRLQSAEPPIMHIGTPLPWEDLPPQLCKFSQASQIKGTHNIMHSLIFKVHQLVNTVKFVALMGMHLVFVPIFHKYSNVPNNIFCELYGSLTHHIDQCKESFYLLLQSSLTTTRRKILHPNLFAITERSQNP